MQRLTVGDQVVVIRGNDKGKRGRVSGVDVVRGRVVVEGVNTVKRHLKATAQRGGGILEVEAPIEASRVMLVDPATDKRTRVKFRVSDEGKERVAKSGTVLPTRV